MDIGAFGPELAVSLGEVLADVVCGCTKIVTEWAGIAGLTSSLPEELAGNVGCVWRASRPFEAGSGCCIGASMSAVGGTHAAVPRVTVLHRDDEGRNE